MFFIIVNLRVGGGGAGAGAFSRDFTVNLSPQCRAFSRALKTEKLKAPLFHGGAGTTNDLCISDVPLLGYYFENQYYFDLYLSMGLRSRLRSANESQTL